MTAILDSKALKPCAHCGMTNNEAVRCKDCGRPKAHDVSLLGKGCFKEWDSKNMTGAHEDCASHAKAKAVPVVDVEKEREAFEAAWHEPFPKNFERDPINPDRYISLYMQMAWKGWLAHAQSSKAVPAEGQRVEEPVAWCVTIDGVRPYCGLSDDKAHVERVAKIVEGGSVMPLCARPASIAEGFVAVPREAAMEILLYLEATGVKTAPEGKVLRAALSVDSGREV